MDDKSLNKFIDKIVDAVDARLAKKPKARLVQAQVTRVDGQTTWVSIPGGASETPCTSSSAECKPGDTVQVQVTKGHGVVLGNVTSKATDDTKANQAQEAAEAAAESAAAANEGVEKTQQYFWFKNGSGDEAGAHVTEISRENFLRNPSGGNLLMRSNSVRIRLGTQILSELSANHMTLASGKAVVKYSEDGSAFGLQDSHRIVVCKGTDEAGVRNDATLSSMDISNWDNTKPMAFFNVTHSVVNGVKSAGGGLFILDGSGNIANLRYATMTDSGIFETSGDVHAGPYSIYDLSTAVDQHGEDIAELQDDVASLPSTFAVETYTLTMSTSALAAGGHLEYAEVKTKAGYYPLSIAGFHSNKQATTVRACYLTDCDDGTCNIHIQIRNDSGNSASANITADVMVLWVKYGA